MSESLRDIRSAHRRRASGRKGLDHTVSSGVLRFRMWRTLLDVLHIVEADSRRLDGDAAGEISSPGCARLPAVLLFDGFEDRFRILACTRRNNRTPFCRISVPPVLTSLRPACRPSKKTATAAPAPALRSGRGNCFYANIGPVPSRSVCVFYSADSSIVTCFIR